MKAELCPINGDLYMKHIFTVFTLVFFLSGTDAVATTFVGTIKNVVCHASGITDVCQVAVNGTVSSHPCIANGLGWVYTLDGTNENGKNLLSILLAAQVSRSVVTIGGTGVCNLVGSSEDLRHVYIDTSN